MIEHGAKFGCEVGATTGRLNGAVVASQTGTPVHCNSNIRLFILVQYGVKFQLLYQQIQRELSVNLPRLVLATFCTKLHTSYTKQA